MFKEAFFLALLIVMALRLKNKIKAKNMNPKVIYVVIMGVEVAVEGTSPDNFPLVHWFFGLVGSHPLGFVEDEAAAHKS